ncbi:hypothetical protein DPEC_G00102460 [Dallia pectoralis]|uniref:Uncharacterized protein n=1 Tax=Dallia pectoralis TaxID=75939 RepID=A0ACC2GX89_DALPE|nr:hypothetical protein DPEC_G00102460 [Dallia pectoralis]
MTIRCLCQMCTFGIWKCSPIIIRKHQCAQGSQPKEPCPIPGWMVSEYQEKYPAHGVTVIRSAKKMKNEYQPLEGTMSNMTTFKSDYVVHEVNRRPPKVTEVFVPPDGRMRHTSTYARDYPIHSVQQKIITSVSDVYHPPTAKMAAQSEYTEEFRAWHIQKVQPYRTSDNLKVNDGKFVGTSTCQDDYGNKGLAETRKSFKPAAGRRESLSFDGTTNYYTQYVSQPVQPRPSSTPISTYRHDYRGLPNEPVKPFRAEVAWERSPAVFRGISESRDQYRAWPLPPKHRNEESCPLRATTSGLPMAHVGDVGPECQKRPSSARLLAEPWTREIGEPLWSSSTMKENYQAWGSPMGFADRLKRPKFFFAGTNAVHSANTSPKTARHAVSSKNTQARDEDSVNHSTNAAKEMSSCPAPGFEYSSMGAGGHRLYRSISGQETGQSQLTTATGDKASHSHSRKSCRTPSRAKRAP